MATILSVLAHDNDTVDKVCARHLGRTAGVTEATLAANPALAEQGPHLRAGTRVDLTAPAQAQPERRDIVQLWD